MAIKYLSPDGLSYFWEQIKGMLGDITATLGNQRTVKIEVSSFSSLPQSVSDSRIKAGDVVVSSVLSDPDAQSSDWTVTTSAGSLTISGSIIGTTSLTLFLTVPE